MRVDANFGMYKADLKATTCIQAKLLLLHRVNLAALPLVYALQFDVPIRWRVAVAECNTVSHASTGHYRSV